MKSDIEIAQSSKIEPIVSVASKLNINEEQLDLYGKYKAKINNINSSENLGKLILVTATNPTPYGEGKTTISIGLGDALNKLNKKTLITLREPSLGPVFGLKGGATGGGYAQVIPMEDINLHFTGDFHAITSANNLLCAAIDNHIKFGNKLNIDINNIKFNRCMDVNDRTLRNIKIDNDGTIRNDCFNITAASEIMVIFCLATSLRDLERRLGNILIGYNTLRKPVYAKDLKVEGAMTVLLKEAFKPNLVQTLENNPVIIHGGPFANIAHGCNSLVATNYSLNLADYVVTEAGFGSDLGAEKFFDIKCRLGDLKPKCVVLVTTIKSLKYNAGLLKEQFVIENTESVKLGIENLKAHIENLKKFGVNIVVCLNKYDSDFDSEINIVKEYCESINIPFSISEAYLKGGQGAIDLATKVIEECNKDNNFKCLYDSNLSIKEKIGIISREIYHASSVKYVDLAQEEIEKLEQNHLDKLPICIAKTQYSISDDKNKLGYPKNYEITVRDVRLYSGAGFITVLLGNIMTMPGLPEKPNYENIKLDESDNIIGIF